MNTIFLVGNLGQEVYWKKTSDERDFCLFSVATSFKYKDKNDTLQEVTEWHNVQTYNPRFFEYIKKYGNKGNQCTIKGRLKYNTFEDNDGVKRTISYIDIEEITLGRL
jgi:single-strand DNA-binding protein